MKKRLLRHSFSLLHVDHVKLNEKWNYTNVISPYFRIYYINDGKGYVSNDQQTVRLEAGFLYIIPSFTLCNLHCQDYLSQYFLHFFEESAEGISIFENQRKIEKISAGDVDVAIFKRLLHINPGRGINRSDNPKVYEKSEYYKVSQELNNEVSDSDYLETQGIMMQLISRFVDSNVSGTKKTTQVPSKILDTIRYIQLHLKENLTVKQLAQRANLHQDYFSRLFFQATGERPLNYIHEKRIERAQYLIATTNLFYAEIAEETGFESLPYFSKVFKKMTSLTPGEYRAKVSWLV